MKSFTKFNARLCKYCEEPIEKSYDAIPDICNRPECVEKTKDACPKILECGHSCCGFKGEKKCLVCLAEPCEAKSAQALNGQTGNDYCMICGIERLVNAPCIQSSCGHVFHLKCITTRILKRWHRPRITFNFCLCPLCKRWLEFPEESVLQQKIIEAKKLYENLKHKSLERLKYEKRDKDERLTTEGDPYYQKPVEYAMAIYSYYECFKCKKPYFGGLKRCEDLMQEENKNDEFKPEELVCAECSNVGITLENCPKHGREFIEFKCRFCCSIATWFCWGTTHFCEPCHKRQCSGDYVSKYSKDKLPKCGGKSTCPLKVDHNGNGEEFALGCALCRNLVNSHDF
jgi:HRD ubiquitin ligase complex, ER membrane component